MSVTVKDDVVSFILWKICSENQHLLDSSQSLLTFLFHCHFHLKKRHGTTLWPGRHSAKWNEQAQKKYLLHDTQKYTHTHDTQKYTARFHFYEVPRGVNSQTQRVEWWWPRLQGRKNGEWFTGIEFQFGKMKKIPDMDGGEGYTI